MTDTTDTTDTTVPTVDTEPTPDPDPNAPRTVTFDAVLLPRFNDELAKLNKLAAKLDVPPITVTEIERGFREVRDPITRTATSFDDGLVTDRASFYEDGREWVNYNVETVTLEIEGATPRLPGGWRFLGAIEHLEAGNLVHGDDARLAAYRDSDPSCDHCGFKRDRAKTVILVDDADTLTQVGSKCLKDFLGYHGNPERVVRWMDAFDTLVDELEDETGGGNNGGRRAEYGEPVDVFLAVAAAAVRVKGWKSKGSAADFGGTSTAEWVGLVFDGPPKNADKSFVEEIREITVTDIDEAKAKAVKEWSTTLDLSDNYLGNLRIILAGTYVGWRKRGLATSAIAAYDKEMGLTAERVKKETRPETGHVGTVGKRSEFTVTVKRIHSYETQYGCGRVMVMEDDDGNVIKTMTSGAWAFHHTSTDIPEDDGIGYKRPRSTSEGDRFRIKGTVKQWGEYKGTKETVLSRVTVLEVLPREDGLTGLPVKTGDE